VPAVETELPGMPGWYHPLRLAVSVYMLFVITMVILVGFEVMFKVAGSVGRLDGLGFLNPHKFFGWQPAQFCYVWRPVVSVVMLGMFGAVALVRKWVLLGRMAVGAHNPSHEIASAFFTMYGLCSACWMQFCSVLRPFSGTPLASLVYNLMGAKVGQNVCLFSLDLLCDFDALEVDDGAFVGPNVFMQCHSFLNNGLGFGTIVIGRNAVLMGCNSLLVSDTTLEHQAVLGPGSIVMRGGTVPTMQYWEGNLARHISIPSCMAPARTETRTSSEVTAWENPLISPPRVI